MIRASGIYMIGRALAALLTIASIAIFSRILAPADYGVYTLSITTAALFNALFCTWVIQSIYRMYSEVADRVRLQSTGLFALLLSALLSAFAALAIILLSGRPVSAELVVGLLLLLTGHSVYEYTNIQLTLRERPSLFVQLQFAKLLLSMALPLSAFVLTRRFDHFMLALGIAFWLPLLIPRFVSWAAGVGVRHVDRTLLISLARYGLPLSFSIVLVQLGQSLDRYILGAQRGVDAVAGYAAGADLALFSIGMMAASLSQGFYPRLLQLYSAGAEDEHRRLFSQYIVLFVGLLLPAAVGLHFVAQELAWLITGKAIRADAALSLGLFAATAFFLNLKAFVVDLRFQIAKRTLPPIVHAGVIVALLIGGCFLLIPTYGGMGAAWASLIAAVGGFMLAALVSTRLPLSLLWPLADLARIAIAVAAMAGVLYGLELCLGSAGAATDAALGVGAKIAAGVAVYALILLLLGFQPARQVVTRVAAILVRRRSV